MYKLIIFDLGGVLFTDGSNLFIQFLSKEYLLPVEDIKYVISGEIGTAYREGKITRDEFWKKVLEKLPIKGDASLLEEQWINSYDLIDETKAIIQPLRRHYSLFYLSDNVKERVDALNSKFQFLSLFDGGVFSHEVGVRKPDPRIYKAILEKAHMKPEESVFIDDKESNLLPAKTLGIETILFTSPKQLRIDLERIGVKL